VEYDLARRNEAGDDGSLGRIDGTTHHHPCFSVSLSPSYWTENHMILYLSSTILLRDRINLDPTDDAVIHVDVRLRHYLNTKIKYGFYEWFSTLYL
jgi:hypothetical protein